MKFDPTRWEMKLVCPGGNTILKISFVAYFIAFVGMIVAANTGHGGWIWAFVGAIPWGDKLGHLVLVGTLSVLLNRVLGRRRAPWKLRFMMLGSLLILLGMSLEEASQCLNPNRSCDPFDWLANVAGIMGGEMLVDRGRLAGRMGHGLSRVLSRWSLTTERLRASRSKS